MGVKGWAKKSLSTPLLCVAVLGAILWGDFVVLCVIFADATAKSTRKIKPCER
ncbi:MAG: hypothetical protein SPH77_06100 [Campylobacter sp.]|uniref:hypothetical protein n=1 Tax=Campylobacter sp. TaxID=205 RepID=UPI002A502E3D|nr:hypothetical protein [Campylobacter sp.]MDD7090072.1 hypothetical protein [Campylobacteraceae bacterium]MCI6178479.1 hypothetical protein [Campylobacter sp.]MDY3245262.1 hypothetical protein [Campylobacter sp.]MDY5285291.1 hypothetical protein [Campylobacter sp.]MDY5384864.1 hypothetical protein [Campylobacter sp.]